MGKCDARLAGKFARECNHKPKAGIVRKWYVNWEDIDRAATQLSRLGTKIDALILKPGAVLYPAEGHSKAHKASHALNVGDFGPGYVHTDNFNVTYRGEEERERIQEIVGGACLVSIIEKKDTGLNGELTYEVVGFESGMYITEDNWSSAENNGTCNLTLSTREGEEEGTGVKLFLMPGGLDETSAWIESNTVVEAVPTV